MDTSVFNERWMQGWLDWSGRYAGHGVNTPRSRKDPIDIVQLEPQDCVPLYPLRYGLTDESCRVDSLGNLSVADYPGGPEGKTYGLRLLRPRSIVYLFYMQEGKLHHQIYQVTDEVCFTPLPQEVAADATGESEFGDQEDFLFPMGALTAPWLPAPKTDVTDTVYLLVTDTLLTTETIASMAGRLDELSGSVLTRVRTDQLAKGQQDVLPISGTLDEGRYVPEMQDELHYIRNPVDFSWSESRPDAPTGSQAVETLNRFFLRFNGEREDIEPLAVVLHDPVGVISELNHRLATQLAELSEHCRANVRQLRVKEQIEKLGEVRYQEYHDQQIDVDVDDDFREKMQELYGEDISSEYVADVHGNVGRTTRLANYRAADAQAFEQEYQQRLTELMQKAADAAADQWNDWQGLQERYHAVLDLYDEADDTNFLDLRVVVAHTLTGLFHDEDGQTYLKSQMDGDKPLANSLLHRALMGHPLINDYIAQDATTADKRFNEALADPNVPLLVTSNNLRVFVDQSVGEAVSRLQNVLNRLPDDAASTQLGMVVSALVRSESGSGTFWPSSWRAMLEVLFGEAARPERVAMNQTGAWFAHVAGGKASHPFRPTTASNDPLYLVRTQKLESQSSNHYTPLKAAIQANVHFWYGIKGLIGGLGMWAALDSLGKARNRLNQKDSQVLVNSLNLGSAMLATGAAGTGMLAVGAGWARDIRMAEVGKQAMTGSVARVADRAGNWTIGLLAASAALISASELLVQAPEESGEARTLTLSSAMLKFGQTGVGGAHLLGKSERFVGLLGSAVDVAEGGFVRRGTSVTAGWVLSAVSINANTAGWIMLGLDVLYSGIRLWHDKVVAERKFTDWIARSCWGTGRGSDGETLQGAFGQDEVEELRQFYRLFQAPHFETEYTAPTRDPYGMTTIEESHAELTVIFPGWHPQVSQFELWHRSGERVLQRLTDPSLVEAIEGYGKLTYQSQALINESRLEIHYWPNRYADDSLILYDEATEMRLDQERIERMERFNALQVEKGSAS